MTWCAVTRMLRPLTPHYTLIGERAARTAEHAPPVPAPSAACAYGWILAAFADSACHDVVRVAAFPSSVTSCYTCLAYQPAWPRLTRLLPSSLPPPSTLQQHYHHCLPQHRRLPCRAFAGSLPHTAPPDVWPRCPWLRTLQRGHYRSNTPAHRVCWQRLLRAAWSPVSGGLRRPPVGEFVGGGQHSMTATFLEDDVFVKQ